MNKRELLLALGRSGKLTKELSDFIRINPDQNIIPVIRDGKYNKAVKSAAGIPIFKIPTKEVIASPQEIKRYLELHCSLIGMEYTGYQEVESTDTRFLKIDTQWEITLANKNVPESWYYMKLPLHTARACGASLEDEAYSPFLSLLERNIWVLGPDKDTFIWYIYNASEEIINYPY